MQTIMPQISIIVTKYLHFDLENSFKQYKTQWTINQWGPLLPNFFFMAFVFHSLSSRFFSSFAEIFKKSNVVRSGKNSSFNTILHRSNKYSDIFHPF